MYKFRALALFALALFAVTLSGCDGRALLGANVVFMGITCAMLWSTINLKKRD